MEAIRQYIKVNGRNISITLPDDFDAEEVEVIILPKNSDIYISDDMAAVLEQRFKEPAEEYLSSEDSIDALKKRYGL